MVKKWKTLERKTGEDYRIFTVDSVHRESQVSGKSSNFFLVNSPDWITIIPVITDENGNKSFLMVKQYRHGSDCITLEFPAGMVDPGEDSLETAKRELLEETGYMADSIKQIGKVNPNPAFMTNSTTTFIAEGLKLVSGQDLDEHEEIEVVKVPVEQFRKKVGGEEVNSAITIQAYYFYLNTTLSIHS